MYTIIYLNQGRTPWSVYRVLGDDERVWQAGFATREQCEAWVQSHFVNAWTEIDRRQDSWGRAA